MIRANLLPYAGTKSPRFGIVLEAEVVRHLIVAIVSIALAALGSASVELWRLHRFQELTAQEFVRVRANDAHRAAVRAVAVQVAHLQDVRSSAAALWDSGNDVALTIAKVGNAIPAGVWLDRLDWNAQSFILDGEARSIEGAGLTAASLERNVQKTRAVLTDVRRLESGRYAFATELDLVQ